MNRIMVYRFCTHVLIFCIRHIRACNGLNLHYTRKIITTYTVAARGRDYFYKLTPLACHHNDLFSRFTDHNSSSGEPGRHPRQGCDADLQGTGQSGSGVRMDQGRPNHVIWALK